MPYSHFETLSSSHQLDFSAHSLAGGIRSAVQNYMNYVDDDWMIKFTSGQETRMRDMVGAFRADLLQNPKSAPALVKAVARVSRAL